MSNRCRVSLPPSSWGYLLILTVVVVGSIMREINLLMILAGLMAGPVVINWRMATSSLRQLQVRRVLPAYVMAKQSCEIRLQITNRHQRLDAWGLVMLDRWRNQTIGGGEGLLSTRSLVPHVRAGDTVASVQNMTVPRRGRYRLGPLRVSTQAPLGLVEAIVVFREADELLVLPDACQLTAVWRSQVESLVDQQSPSRRQGALAGEYFGLRDWRSGDSRRWIHWRSSAKRRQWVVRQFEQPQGQSYALWVDLGRIPANDAAALERAETVVRFAAALLTEWCQRSIGSVRLMVAAERNVVLQTTASPGALTPFLEALADARTTTQDALAALTQAEAGSLHVCDRSLLLSAQAIDLHDQQRFRWLQEPLPWVSSWLQTTVADFSRAESQAWWT